MEDSSSIFKERLNAAMKAKGYSNAALARETHLSAAAIGNYVKGRMPRGCDEIVRLARTLDTTPDFLLGFSDDPTGGRRDYGNFDNYADVFRTLQGLAFAFLKSAHLSIEQSEQTEVRLSIRDEKLIKYFVTSEKIDQFIIDMPESYDKLKMDLFERMHNDKIEISYDPPEF